MSRTSLILLTLSLTAAAACENANIHQTEVRSGMTAAGVTIQIPLGEESSLVAAGDRMDVDGTGSLTLCGDASVTMSGRNEMRATAQKITVDPEGPKVEMDGNVRASFAVPGDLQPPQGDENANL